ncbi:MAG: hypothetical protein KC589_03335 [Nanoarchaeota archaeon]|nr:hypothetical protein [Nanoarchaeota archaeon]
MIVGLLDIIRIVDDVVMDKGDDSLGDLSWYGMMDGIERYFKGRYNDKVHNFIKENLEYFKISGVLEYDVIMKNIQKDL